MMRTFSEYINEARQNYIFGGTDDRNADVKLKVWANVKKGDKIYVWRAREERKVSLERIIDIENRQTKKKIDAENCLSFVNNDELDSDVHCTVGEYNFCIATNFGALQAEVKKVFGKDITEENIREFGVRESTHNYIFGGTDDRNINVSELKSFGELIEGDTIYISSKYNIVAASFLKLKHITGVDELVYTYKDAKDNYILSLDKTSYDNLSTADFAIANNYTRYFISTDADKIVKVTNNMWGTNFTINDIVDRQKVNEERQNYIFGGTDNRVPKIGSTPIDALSEGDKIYYWSKSYGREAYECKVTKEEETDGEFAIDVIMDDEKNTLFVYKKFYERGSDVCVCKHDRVFAVFATDEETFLDACNENSIKIDNIVR